MKKIPRLITALLAITLLLSLSGCGASDGKTHLTFQIWDVGQRPGMQAICDAYTAQHPDVEIEVQVTSWSEYWTKLEAAAESNTMPDIFWMHTDQILYYADFGILADVTDLYEDPNFWTDHYSDVSISNVTASDGRMYGVPKDKDNVVLVYNKNLFDQAGLSYPDESWTWDDLERASQQIYDKTGKYGYLAYNDEQLGYWNFVYQNGGYILDPETNIHAGYTQPATAEAIKYYVGLQQNDWCPDQKYFAETTPGTAFFGAQEGAMFFEGSWNLLATLQNYPNLVGMWDIAPLPKCPDPVSGDGRGTISNGLCYATAAKGKNLEIVKDVLRFFGSEEGQRIQGESGAAIPAYLGQEETWSTVFQNFDYMLNLDVCYDQFEYCVQYVNNATRRKWKSTVSDEMVRVYNGSDIDASLAKMQEIAESYVISD